ncbi:MAG TPA: TolC family protein [Blastocatellia bacterium]|nr:TolC family protein [Blastocatellia bacterium]
MKTYRLRDVSRNFLSHSLTVICAIFCASLISPFVAAQNPPAQPSTTINTQDIVARPIPLRTIGLEPGKIKKWSQRDAIMAALENNIEIDLERENVRLMQYDLIAAQGFYDPSVTSSIFFNKSITPTAARVTGLESGNTVTSDALIYNFSGTQNFERWGSRVQAEFNNRRQGSNINTLTTSYQPSLEFTFTQPLFRGLAIDQTRRQIRITKKSMDLTDAQFRQRVILIISQVQQAYWDLSLAINNERVQRDSVTLAETFLENTKRQVEVGTQAPIETISAATQLEQRRQSVFQAMNAVAQAENRLKALTASGPTDELWSSLIEPTEPFDIKPYSIQVTEAVKLAHENRPEIRQQSLNKEINSINVDFFRNQAKPQIDLVASYSTNGLGGTGPSRTSTTCPSPFTDPVTGRPVCAAVVPEIQNGAFVPAIRTVPFESTTLPPVADRFIGGYGTALGNLFKNQFRTWQVGVQISLPIRNRTAKANLGRQLEIGRQIDLQTRQLMQNIEQQVRNAVQEVETAKMRIDAAEAQENYARQQLDGENKRFAAGLQTTFIVLTRQNELAGAQLSKLQALADYNKAMSNLQSVMSTTLSNNGIELKQEAPVTIK